MTAKILIVDEPDIAPVHQTVLSALQSNNSFELIKGPHHDADLDEILFEDERRKALEEALERLRKDQEFRNSPAEVEASLALMAHLEPALVRVQRYTMIGKRVLQGLFARKMDEDRGFELMLPDGPFKRLKAYHPAHLPTMINGMLLLFGGRVDHQLHNRYWALSNIPPWEGTLWA